MSPINVRVGASILVISVCGAGGFFLARHRAGARGASQHRARPEPAAPKPGKPKALAAPVAADDDPFLGLLLAHDQVNVAAKLDGRIDKVFFRLGDHVNPGDVLCEQDSRELRRALQMAEASLQAARAEEEKAALELSQASDRLQRRLALGKSGVSGEDLESAGYQEKLNAAHLSTARATTAERRAHRDQLREQLKDTEIRAPFGGQIAARFVDPGTLATHGTPLMRLISDRGLWLRIAVPQDRSASIQKGTRVRAIIDELDRPVEGVIEKVAPEVDAASQMIFAEARVEGQDGRESTLSGRVARVMVAPPPHAVANSPSPTNVAH